jgi:hypothetical protein
MVGVGVEVGFGVEIGVGVREGFMVGDTFVVGEGLGEGDAEGDAEGVGEGLAVGDTFGVVYVWTVGTLVFGIDMAGTATVVAGTEGIFVGIIVTVTVDVAEGIPVAFVQMSV